MYPTGLIVIFLLFIAILAFGWFYWQRAKARDAAKATDAAPAAEAPAVDASTASPDMATASSDVAPASGTGDQQYP